MCETQRSVCSSICTVHTFHCLLATPYSYIFIWMGEQELAKENKNKIDKITGMWHIYVE